MIFLVAGSFKVQAGKKSDFGRILIYETNVLVRHILIFID